MPLHEHPCQCWRATWPHALADAGQSARRRWHSCGLRRRTHALRPVTFLRSIRCCGGSSRRTPMSRWAQGDPLPKTKPAVALRSQCRGHPARTDASHLCTAMHLRQCASVCVRSFPLHGDHSMQLTVVNGLLAFLLLMSLPMAVCAGGGRGSGGPPQGPCPRSPGASWGPLGGWG